MGYRIVAALLVLCTACSAGRTPASPTTPRPVPDGRVAVTIDDVPWVGGLAPGDTRDAATGRILAALVERGVPATGFVVCARLGGERDPVLAAWSKAGMSLGNHSTTHDHLDALAPQDWAADVAACRARLADELGAPPRWFRYPFLQTGATEERRDAARAVLTSLGHEVAPVSIDTSEWVLVAPYVEALASGDRTRAEAIGAAYVRHVVAATRHFRARARGDHGRDVAHVLLLHANALAADHLGAVLDALAAEGLAFVSLDEALADAVYALPDRYAGEVGLSWLYRVAADTETSWAFDHGQEAALARRFAGAPDERPLRIDRDLVVRPLGHAAFVVVHEDPWPANTLVVEMADGTLVVVGTPYTPEATARLLAWLAARFGPRPLVAVNPHFHHDAAGGNAALLAAGARVYASDHTARLIAERAPAVAALVREWLAERPEAAARLGDGTIAAPSDVFPEAEGLTLRFGADTVRVVYPGPAHALDNVIVHFPEHDLLFGGCMLIGGDRVGNTSDADLARWPESVARLRDLPASIVVPGHGDRTDRGLIDNTEAVVRAAQTIGGVRPR